MRLKDISHDSGDILTSTINMKYINFHIELNMNHSSESLIYSWNLKPLTRKIYPSKHHEIINKDNII